MTCAISVAMLGIGTVESVPIYHYHPGGLAVRVRLSVYADDVYNCDSEHEDICIFSRRGSLEPETIEAERLARVILSYRPDIVVVEAPKLDGAGTECLLNALRGRGATLAVRTLASNVDSALRLDPGLMLPYYPLDYLVEPGLKADMILGLSRLARSGVPAEVSVYLEDPDPVAVRPVALALEGSGAVLHVHVRNHKGGVLVREVYEKLRKVLDHVYVHNDLYPYEDTVCPSCGAVVAVRREGRLERLVAPGGRCWRCSTIIPFHGRIRERTPRSITLATGGIRWIHPRLLKTSFSRGPM